MEYRKEKDFLGEKEVPRDAYWGVHTQRARDNFSLSRLTTDPGLIRAMAIVKKAAAQANLELEYLPKEKAAVIIAACDEIIEGALSDQFSVDALQGGAGTSTNMNVNEVIANRALELSGRQKGGYEAIHPVQDVNMHQSTNDVYPTALKVAAIYALRALSADIAQLQGAFQKKEKEFAEIVKIGRTELQEAVPITLGAEFGAFAEAFARDRWRTFKCEERLRVVNIGGTAVGTGLTAPRSYIFLVVEKLRDATGMGLCRGENLLDTTANSDCFVEVSGILKAYAVSLIKISNDLRLMNLLQEITLPALQAGSSIMAGKINPVVLEAVMQAGMKVIANDAIITDCCAKATFQINEFMPLVAQALLESLSLASRAAGLLAGHVAAIKANAHICLAHFNISKTIITAFLPQIGYDAANRLLEEFTRSGQDDLRRFLSQKLGSEIVEKTLSPHNLISLGFKDHGKNT